MNTKNIYILLLSFFSFPAFAIPLYGKMEITFFKPYPKLCPVNLSPISAQELGIGSSQITLYPNPTQGNFNVEIELEKNTEVDITIYNAIGKIIYLDKVNGSQGTFKTLVAFEDHPAGVYFVHIKAGPIKSVERLIKIK